MWLACDVSDLAESRLPNMQYLTGTRILFSTRFPGGVVSGGRVGGRENGSVSPSPAWNWKRKMGRPKKEKTPEAALTIRLGDWEIRWQVDKSDRDLKIR